MSTHYTNCPIHAFNPFAEPYLSDPYAIYAWARAQQPVFYSAELGYWVLSRNADVRAALKDAETFSSRNSTDPFTPITPETARIFREGGYAMQRVLLNAVPPDHTRIRRHVYAAFTPQRVAGMEAHIRALAAKPERHADIVGTLTYELPAQIIFALLGLSESEVLAVKAGSESRVLFTWGQPTPEQQAELAHNMVAFWQLSADFVQRRAAEPHDDFTSALLRIHANDQSSLSMPEIVSIVFGLLLAGHETTTGLLTNAIRQFLARPEVWAQLVVNPAMIPTAIEEVLRMDTSVIAMRRLTTRPVQIANTEIPADANVLLLIGSANHDEALFERPHELDLERTNTRDHLAFGFGSHYCIGAPLARLEARIVIEELAHALPTLRLCNHQQYDYLPNTSFRSPRQLLIEW